MRAPDYRSPLFTHFSAYNTSQALAVLPNFLPTPQQSKIIFMTIFFGANDACIPDSTGQHVPLEKYSRNLRVIAEHPSVQTHKPMIIFITPPPVDEYQFDALDEPWRSARNAATTKAYADTCKQVAKELNLPVVDIWGAVMEEAGWVEGQVLVGSKQAERNETMARILYDGLHLSGDGYKLLFREIMKAIGDSWPDQTPDKLPFVYEPFFQ